MEFPSFAWSRFAEHGISVLLAFVIALPVAWEREVSNRIMGLRTLPIVAVASCAYILVGIAIVGDDPRAHGRLLSGLVAGIGFIGGGAILKNGDNVRGTATAASILSTGVLGAAVGYGLLEIAVLISLSTLALLLLLRPVKDWLEEYEKKHGREHGNGDDSDSRNSG